MSFTANLQQPANRMPAQTGNPFVVAYRKRSFMFELKCADVGFDCPGVVRGTTREQVLQQAAAHAREVHRTEVTPEMAGHVMTLIREQAPPAAGAAG